MNLTIFPSPVEQAVSLLDICKDDVEAALKIARFRYFDAPRNYMATEKDSEWGIYWREVLETLKGEGFQC